MQEFRVNANRQSIDSVHSKEESVRLRTQLGELRNKLNELENKVSEFLATNKLDFVASACIIICQSISHSFSVLSNFVDEY